MALIKGFPVPGPSPPVESWTLFLHLSSGPALLLWPEEYNPSGGVPVPVSRGHVRFCSFSVSAAWMCLLGAEGPRREEPMFLSPGCLEPAYSQPTLKQAGEASPAQKNCPVGLWIHEQ